MWSSSKNKFSSDQVLTSVFRRRWCRALAGLLLVLVILLSLEWFVDWRSHTLQTYAEESKLAQWWIDKGVIGSEWASLPFYRYSQRSKYAAENRALPASDGKRVVFFGDSITERWKQLYPDEFFPGHSYLNRGISRQITPQMVLRFRQDVLDLHPDTLVLLAGTNDIIDGLLKLRTGDVNNDLIVNFMTMVDLARAHGIRVILCSIPPEALMDSDSNAIANKEIRSFNRWLAEYCQKNKLAYVDYYSALIGKSGEFQDSLFVDRVHPNESGYRLMQPLAQAAIDSASDPNGPEETTQ